MQRDLHHLKRRSAPSLRSALASPHRGLVEVAALVGLYGLYEVVRGFGELNFDAAYAHTADIVSLEQGLSVFVERDVQQWAQSVPGLASLLGLAYIVFHVAVTAGVLAWVYRAHRERFALVRTSLVATTAIALVGYVVYPAAPPRLADLGFTDTVTQHTGLNLSSDLLGSFYNPIAAVPSLHFGYALLAGVAVAAFATRRSVRILGAAYPAAMLFIIVATGNHFLFDAAAGGAVTVLGWLVARSLVRPATVAAWSSRPSLQPLSSASTRVTALRPRSVGSSSPSGLARAS